MCVYPYQVCMHSRPDITIMVDWALKINYLSFCVCIPVDTEITLTVTLTETKKKIQRKKAPSDSRG